MYQHKVEPFSLADPTKPGLRTIVAFFLCDPSYRVLSTSDIPPQQRSWLEAVLHNGHVADPTRPSLPTEIRDRIMDILEEDGAIVGRESAEYWREQLMQERSAFGKIQNDDVFEAEFS